VSIKIQADFVCERRELASACDCRTSEANGHLTLKEGDLGDRRKGNIKIDVKMK